MHSPGPTVWTVPGKGTIAVGSSGDVVVYDPERPKTISAETEMSKCDYSIYDGFHVQGSVDSVVFAGEVIVRDGQYIAESQKGGYLPRERFVDPSGENAE